MAVCADYLSGVSRRTHPKKPPISEAGASSSCAAVVNISARSKRPDRERAEAVAIKQFALDDDQRRRLLIRERD
jgi:hypothetical protein